MTDTDKEGIRRGFVAERRNLLLTSVVLFLVEYSDLRFEQINVLGNEAQLRDPNVIRSLIWIFCSYFAWRYYQHYQAIKDSSITDKYREKLYQFFLPIAHERYAQRYEPSSTYLDQKPSFNFTSAPYNLHRPWHATVTLTGRAGYRLESGALAQDAQKVEEIDLHWRDLLWPHAKAGWFVLKNMWQFTEYYLPFFVALLPLFYVLFKTTRTTWNGLAS
jgi:hypothetical protein